MSGGYNSAYQPFTSPDLLVPATSGHVPLHTLTGSRRDRHAHILRLHEIVIHLCHEPYSPANATRLHKAWSLLCQCPEYEVEAGAWRTGLLVIEKTKSPDDDEHQVASRQARWIQHCREHRLERVEKLVEYVLCLARADKHREALDELEALLPSHPYNESIQLNVLAGQLCLYLSQPRRGEPRLSQSLFSQLQNRSSNKKGKRKRRRRLDSSSSSDSSSSTSSGAQERTQSQQRQQADLKAILQDCEMNDAHLFNRARGHFRHARDLEDEADDANGEGERWYNLLSSIGAGATLADSSSDETESSSS